MWMMNTMKKNEDTAPVHSNPVNKKSASLLISELLSRYKANWLLATTLGITVVMPLLLYFSRDPNASEFDYLIYYRLLFFNDFFNSLAMLAAFLAALFLGTLRRWIEQLADWVTRYPVKTSVITFIGLAISARIVYQGFPLAMDEYAPVLQARIFAQGNIALTYPVELMERMLPFGFSGMFIFSNPETGQISSAYWPGLALLMTPFAVVEMEWLLNPLLAAIGVWLIGDLAYQASQQPQARGWAMLAALACPQYTINAMSYYAMTGLLTLNLLYLWLLLRPGFRNVIAAGVVGSMALVMHHPIAHTLFALPCIIWLFCNSTRHSRIFPLGLGYLPLTLLICFGWPLLTHSMNMNYKQPAVHDSDVVMSLHTSFISKWIYIISGTFSIPSLSVLIANAYALCKVIIWSAPGLLLISLCHKKQSSIQRLLLAGFLLSFLFYLLFPSDQGHGWGYRYVHPGWGLLAVSAGIFAMSKTIAYRNFIAAAVIAGLLATPVFALQTSRTVSISRSLQTALQPDIATDGTTLVFVTINPAFYTADLVRNYPKDKGRKIMMVSYGPEQDSVLAMHLSPQATQIASSPIGSIWQLPSK